MTLPANWVEAPIGEVSQINPRDFAKDVPGTSEVSFVPMAAVEACTGAVDVSDVRPWFSLSGKSYTRFAEGDVLFAKITPCMENGKFAIATGLKNGAGVGSTEFHVVRPLGEIDPKYILYYLLQESVRSKARSVMSGAVGQLRVPTDFLVHLTIPLAPLPEQHRIVAEIEKQLTRLDATVGALRRVQANLKRYRASVLKAAVEGRLVAKEGEWQTVRVSDIAEVQGGIQKQPKRRPVANHYPYLRVANVLRGRLDLSEVHRMELFGRELERLRLRADDLLVVEGNGSPSEIGRMAIWSGEVEDCVHQNHIIRVRCGNDVLPQYLLAYWNSPKGSDAVMRVSSSTSGLNTLSVAKVSALTVALPGESEQLKIINEIERRLSVTDALQSTIDHGLIRAERLRQSVLKRAFEGKLVPQDKDDEPASLLLERIQAERVQTAPAGRGRAARRGKQLMLGETVG